MGLNLRLIVVTLVIIAAVLIAFFLIMQPSPRVNDDSLFQISAFNTFSDGNFEGKTTYSELEKHGDFGIGTLNGLDGEMIALDGEFYQIPTSGTPRRISSSEKTPYATITFFNTDQTIQVTNALNYSQLAAEINVTLPDHNSIYAIKVSGVFKSATTRSVPPQTKPYPTLTQALQNQKIFTLEEVEGTAVGFYFPNNMEGVDFPGYHLHFLTDDRLAGGHLLECIVDNAKVEIDRISSFHLQIP